MWSYGPRISYTISDNVSEIDIHGNYIFALPNNIKYLKTTNFKNIIFGDGNINCESLRH